MKKLLLVAICLLGTAALIPRIQAQQPFIVAPQYPLGGAEISITYNPAVTPLAESRTVTGVIYLCDGNDWTAHDLDLAQEGDRWTATYLLPENSVLLACKFYGDDPAQGDSGSADNSYGMFVYKMDGDQLVIQPGTFLHRGLIASRTLDRYAVPGYLHEEDRIDDRNTMGWLQRESMSFPESAEKLVFFAYTLLNSYEPGEHHEQLLNDIQYMLSSNDTEELSLLRAAQLCRSILQNDEKRLELEAVAAERFPGGLQEREQAIFQVFSERDSIRKFDFLEAFVERFPPLEYPVPRTFNDDAYYPRIFWYTLRERSDCFYNLGGTGKIPAHRALSGPG
ncbi:MAG: hypothetical protein LUD68_00805 [Rikenellaceae bacterium]|nr:hypothetical protein [Rikenellaceae bacterium]